MGENSPYATDINFRNSIALWQVTMAGYIKNHSGNYNHLITTSYAGGPQDLAYTHSFIDITNRHRYGDERNINITARFNEANQNLLNYDKPFIFGEIGNDITIEECTDVNFHNNLWSTAFMGGFGAGINWFMWHNDSYRNNFTAISNFMQGIDFESREFLPQTFPEQKHVKHNDNSVPILEAFTLKSSDNKRAMGWVHNRTNYWGNLGGSNACINDLITNGVVSIPTDDDSYSLPQNIGGEKFKIRGMQRLRDYRIDWYWTSGTGAFFYAQIKRSGVDKVLRVTAPNMFAGRHDFAYKIYRDNISFKTAPDTTPDTNIVANQYQIISQDTSEVYIEVEEKAISDNNIFEGYHLNNYPNPFSEGTIIGVYLPGHFGHSEIIVYDIIGVVVKRFALKSGHNFIEINAGDLEHGTYLYSLISAGYKIETKTMVHVK